MGSHFLNTTHWAKCMSALIHKIFTTKLLNPSIKTRNLHLRKCKPLTLKHTVIRLKQEKPGFKLKSDSKKAPENFQVVLIHNQYLSFFPVLC